MLRSLPLFLVLSACAPLQAPDALSPLAKAPVQRGAATSSSEAMLAAAREANLVCMGEQHDDALHHRAQLAMLTALAQQDRPLALGMEMFQRPFQPAIDDYLAGQIDDAQLVEETDWKNGWGYDYAMYQPMLQLAQRRGLPVLALNAPRALTQRVAHQGLDDLPEGMWPLLPQMKLDDANHRRFFWAAMGFDGGDDDHHHHGAHPSMNAEQYYAAQVIWDETMAQTAATWLAPAPDRRQVLIVAGNGHCHDSAIAARVRRRLPQVRTVTIRLLGSDDEPSPHTVSDFLVRIGQGS